MSTKPDPTTEPLYAATVADTQWHPGLLRPPFDLNDVLARSYEKAMTTVHLRRQLAKRAQAKKARRPRKVHLP